MVDQRLSDVFEWVRSSISAAESCCRMHKGLEQCTSWMQAATRARDGTHTPEADRAPRKLELRLRCGF